MKKQPNESIIANLLQKIEDEFGFTDFILIGTVDSSEGMALNVISSFGMSNRDMITMLIETIATINESEEEDDAEPRH